MLRGAPLVWASDANACRAAIILPSFRSLSASVTREARSEGGAPNAGETCLEVEEGVPACVRDAGSGDVVGAVGLCCEGFARAGEGEVAFARCCCGAGTFAAEVGVVDGMAAVVVTGLGGADGCGVGVGAAADGRAVDVAVPVRAGSEPVAPRTVDDDGESTGDAVGSWRAAEWGAASVL